MTRVVTLVLAGVMMAALAAGEEHERPPWEGRSRGEPREVIETVRMARLAKALDLDEEETVKLVRRYNTMRDTQRTLDRAHAAAVNELRELIRDDASAEQIEDKLAEVREKEAEVLRHRWAGFEDVVKGLNAEQQAKLYVFAQDFEADMRRLVERARSMRWDGRREWPGDSEEGRRGPPRNGPRNAGSPWSSWPRMHPDEWEARVREWRELEPGEREEWLRQWRGERRHDPHRNNRGDNGGRGGNPDQDASDGHDEREETHRRE